MNQGPFNTISIYRSLTCEHVHETRYSGEPLGLLLRDLLLSARHTVSLIERLSITFRSNGKRELVPRDQVSFLLVVCYSLFLHTN